MSSKLSSAASPLSKPLHVTIRFADSIPDLLLDIPTQTNITGHHNVDFDLYTRESLYEMMIF
ncbi:hypothetical protein BofuT4_uP065160.1 [Botrytis cinerea T4]|uniref:DSC E3 ubiquitin ligase complex subunit 3 ubiquitin-like domain-containing protein n=1 Tax=Botryotinia fuckeliana (strain T4) TaxID=999810 RepID=G2XSN7_BOTF4|nr:hypothetical protein BofuT4_uP065160.1 [Botrytis cinerea T4]